MHEITNASATLLDDVRRCTLMHRLDYSESTISQIARVAEAIPGVRKKIIDQVSSSYYALAPQTSMLRAIVAIGLDRTTTLVREESRAAMSLRESAVKPKHISVASYAAAAAHAFSCPPLDAFPIALCRSLIKTAPESEQAEMATTFLHGLGLQRLDRIGGDWTRQGSLTEALERACDLGLYKAGLAPSPVGTQAFDAAAESRARHIEGVITSCFVEFEPAGA